MRPLWKDVAAALAVAGVMALYVAAAIVGLITGNNVPLAVLMTATIAAWLVATGARHAFTAPPGSALGRDAHEVIHPEKTAVH